jgi:hypothetical protein
MLCCSGKPEQEGDHALHELNNRRTSIELQQRATAPQTTLDAARTKQQAGAGGATALSPAEPEPEPEPEPAPAAVGLTRCTPRSSSHGRQQGGAPRFVLDIPWENAGPAPSELAQLVPLDDSSKPRQMELVSRSSSGAERLQQLMATAMATGEEGGGELVGAEVMVMCEAVQAGWASIAGALLSGGATAVSFTQPVHGGLAAMLGGSGSGSNPSAVMVVDERADTATAVFFMDGCEIARQAVASDDTMAARTVRAAVTCAAAASTVVAAAGGRALQWILCLTAAATPAADDLRLAAGDSGAFDWPPSQVVGSQQTPVDAAILLASLRTCEPPHMQYARSRRCTRPFC